MAYRSEKSSIKGARMTSGNRVEHPRHPGTTIAPKKGVRGLGDFSFGQYAKEHLAFAFLPKGKHRKGKSEVVGISLY
jgi:hypothetical protein